MFYAFLLLNLIKVLSWTFFIKKVILGKADSYQMDFYQVLFYTFENPSPSCTY